MVVTLGGPIRRSKRRRGHLINALQSADAVVGAKCSKPTVSWTFWLGALTLGLLHELVGQVNLSPKRAAVPWPCPKMRTSIYFPDWLLEWRKRAESGPSHLSVGRVFPLRALAPCCQECS